MGTNNKYSDSLILYIIGEWSNRIWHEPVVAF